MFKHFRYQEERYHGKSKKIPIESQVKLEKSQGIPCLKFDIHPVMAPGDGPPYNLGKYKRYD